MRIQPAFSTTPPQTAGDRKLAFPSRGPVRRAAIQRLVETTAEILWVILLVLVIGFFLSKASTISSIFDEAAAAMHRGGEPAVRPNEAQIQDLELRMATGERKLLTLERGYSQLRQRHADLLRAYAALQQGQKPVGGGMAPQSAARARN